MNHWQTKEFKTREAMDKWIAKHGSKYQWKEIFINNAFGVECRKLRRIL
jgi:hypothetical protein